MWNPSQYVTFPAEISQVVNFLRSQLVPLPYPTTSFSGKTIIVTGANTGLGLEAARHFVRLGAAKVIFACRDVERAEAVLKSIGAPLDVAEVWQVDLCSHKSVKSFCARVQNLDRLDVLVENAAIKLPRYEEFEKMETTITVNVISTSLMAMLLLPKLQSTGTSYNTIPHLVVVGSNAHTEAKFKEQYSASIFEALRLPGNQEDRYGTSKLIQLLAVRELSSALARSGSKVVLNTPNPGFCMSEIMRHSGLPVRVMLWLLGKLVGRTSEEGSRTIVASAIAGPESHGRYMEACEVSEPSAWAQSEKGQEAQKRVYKELLEILERITPGVTEGFESSDTQLL